MSRIGKVALIFAAVVISVSIALRQARWARLEENIPPQFEIVDRVLLHTELLGSCGMVVFRISDTSLSKIKSQGQGFLRMATVARVPSKYPYESYSHFTNWQSTPVPENWRNEGDGSWMYCPPFPDATVSKLIEAAKADGSYYTSTDYNTKLFLAPSLGLIVYSYFD